MVPGRDVSQCDISVLNIRRFAAGSAVGDEGAMRQTARKHREEVMQAAKKRGAIGAKL
jgi:hypothetical protein